METISLAQKFRIAFPDWPAFPCSCAVRQAIEGPQTDFDEAINVVTRSGHHESLIRRLLDAHPSSCQYLPSYDSQLWDVMREAEANAWVMEMAGVGCPAWTQQQRGSLDLRVNHLWVEAKTIHLSHQELAGKTDFAKRAATYLETDHNFKVPAGLIRKLDCDLSNATTKEQRQDSGNLVVFFEIAFDWPPVQDRMKASLSEWAADAEQRTGAKLVLCHNFNWREPFDSSF